MADERKKNSFHKLMEQEYEPRFTVPQMMEIERRIQRQQNSYRVAGDMLDLFFPKIIKTMIGMLGGDDSSDDGNHPAPSEMSSPYKPKGPNAPGRK
jgi:hypothetical protein